MFPPHLFVFELQQSGAREPFLGGKLEIVYRKSRYLSIFQIFFKQFFILNQFKTIL